MSKKQKILIIDDIDLNLTLMSKFLEELDIDIEYASTGGEALEKAETENLDLVILDLNLPDINGFEVLKKIRAKNKYKHLPIIIVSAVSVDDESIVKALSIGADDYLTKPISGSVIKTKVKLYLEKYELRKKAISIENELKETNNKLKELLFLDDLTGAINRKPFMDLLVRRINSSKRANHKIALLFMDFDDFKRINDEHGHDIGDDILKKIIPRIQGKLRQSDLLGRIGGDEFLACLLDIKSVENAKVIAGRINQIFDNKIISENTKLELGISIGIAIYPDDADNCFDLIRNSDLAMYQAKRNTKNSFTVFNK
ncbi:MAG: diguanylate cyclase [bacterium]|nr:diguanylate cyclase [bacterium]